MKILIVGAGVIGTIYGWAFSAAGHDVTHFVRLGRKQQLASGICMDILDSRSGQKKHNVLTYPLKAVESLAPSDEYELIMVPTKHYQLGATLKQIADKTNSADFLIFTGNWCGTAEVDSILPRSRYLWGDPIAGGGFKDGILVTSLKPKVMLGEIDGQHTARLEKLVGLFASADIKAEIPENIIHWHWLQYAINAGLLGALARAGSLEKVTNGSLDDALLAVKEALDVCIKRGVDLNKFPGPRSSYNVSPVRRLLAAAALMYLIKFDESAKRNIAHALNNPQEVESFYCDVLNTGRELGVAIPHFASFEKDIQEFVKTSRSNQAMRIAS